MAERITLPELAEGIAGGDVVSVAVSEGDTVTEGQTLIELETDKATVPVPSPAAGKIVKVLAKVGEPLQVGEPIVELEGAPGAVKAPPPPEKPAKPPRHAERPPAEPATEAEQVEMPPEERGAEKPAEEQRVEARQARQREVQARPEPGPAETPPGAPEAGEPAPAGPAARRLARELGVDINRVPGSSRGGRISPEDVKDFARQRMKSGVPGVTPAAAELPDFARWGPVRRETLTTLRRKISDNLARAWVTIPHVHQFDDADITDLAALRKAHAPRFKERGANLTMTAFLLKAVVATLQKFPQFNASLDPVNGEMVFKDYFHIGVAVDTPGGLIVPVLRDVDRKDLYAISRELGDLAQRTRDRQVGLEELRGASFSVSNLGGIGGSHFTPIINPPEVAILGVGRSREVPVWRNGQVVPRTILPLCVAYDHRVIDGADGARFITELVRTLEHYQDVMLLGL